MDKISYLTPNIGLSRFSDDTLHSRLLRMLDELKQPRAGAKQWQGIIGAFSQKGVKAAEIDDSRINLFLSSKTPEEKIEKTELMTYIARTLPRIKCVDLAHKGYASHRNTRHGSYTERLYILASEAMIGDDMLDDLMFRIEDLGFNPGPLITDPGIVDRLEAEMAMIKALRPDMFDFAHHHYSKQVKVHGKNLMAHARFAQVDDLMFIEEIQSDWAQKGRRFDWINGYPKAPLVTNTEQWAGVVLRDILHQAALNPECKQVAWIGSHMRNGYDTQEGGDSDGLALFYSSIVKKLAEKCIDKAGGRVLPMNVQTVNGERSVLGFEMTDKVRQALVQSLPLYSREAMLPRGAYLEDPTRNMERARVLQEATLMLGDSHTIRFVDKLFDASFSNEVAGKYMNRGITISLRAKSLDRASRHESWHFAEENFLFQHERREMRLAFAPGSDLNRRTQETLRAMGEMDAAEQCFDERECAAHAFSLWCEGRMEVSEDKPRSMFEVVLKSLTTLADWLEEKVFGVKVQSPEDLFQAMRDGVLALRQAEQAEEEHAPSPAG